MAVLVELGHLQLNATGCAMKCILQGDKSLGSLVPSACTKPGAGTLSGEISYVKTLSEKGFEEVTEPARRSPTEAETPELEMGLPPRRWPGLIACLPTIARLVVSRRLFGFFEYFGRRRPLL